MDGMTAPGDRIEEYLRTLRAGLRTRPQETGRILAEAEDHLREAVAAGLAAGLTEAESQEAAISSFGSVRTVVRAHEKSHGTAAVLVSLVMAAWKLAWTFLLALGAVGVVALIFDVTAGQPFVGASAPRTRFTAAKCSYWMRINPGAHNCAQAAMLESSGDIVVDGVACALFGLLLLEGYFLVHHFWHRRGRQVRDVLPRAFFPVTAIIMFGALALGCGLAAAVKGARGGGPGEWLSGAIVCTVLAVAYVLRLRQVSFLRHAPGRRPGRAGWASGKGR